MKIAVAILLLGLAGSGLGNLGGAGSNGGGNDGSNGGGNGGSNGVVDNAGGNGGSNGVVDNAGGNDGGNDGGNGGAGLGGAGGSGSGTHAAPNADTPADPNSASTHTAPNADHSAGGLVGLVGGNIVNAAVNAAGHVGNAAVNAAGSVVDTAVNAAVNAAGHVGNAAVNAAGHVGNAAVNAVSTAANAAGSVVDTAVNAAGSAVSTAVNAAGSAVSTAVDTVLPTADSVTAAAKKALPGSSKQTVEVASVVALLIATMNQQTKPCYCNKTEDVKKKEQKQSLKAILGLLNALVKHSGRSLEEILASLNLDRKLTEFFKDCSKTGNWETFIHQSGSDFTLFVNLLGKALLQAAIKMVVGLDGLLHALFVELGFILHAAAFLYYAPCHLFGLLNLLQLSGVVHG
ncbi:uncharacterized protein O3C94_000575 [Discoglossus pictus]